MSKKPESAKAKARFEHEKQVYELNEEIIKLRKLAGMGDDMVIALESWEASGQEQQRDVFAARALIAEWGNQARALQRLGFNVMAGKTWDVKVVAVLSEAVFNTPGVREILDQAPLSNDGSWAKILERTRKTALIGDDESAVKAAQLLAKVEGRIKDTKKQLPPAAVSLHVLVNNQGNPATVGIADVKQAEAIETHDPLSILAHEPSDTGVPIPVDEKDLPVGAR
jgi:hypothetical protein